jgi:hypothetical protein
MQTHRSPSGRKTHHQDALPERSLLVAVKLRGTRSAVTRLVGAAGLREIAERAEPLHFGLLIHGASIEIMYAGTTARQAYGLIGRKVKVVDTAPSSRLGAADDPPY